MQLPLTAAHINVIRGWSASRSAKPCGVLLAGVQWPLPLLAWTRKAAWRVYGRAAELPQLRASAAEMLDQRS